MTARLVGIILGAVLFALVVISVGYAEAVQATANWTNPTSGAAPTGIRVDRRDGPDTSPWIQQGPLLAVGVTTFNQSGLAISTRYCYRVVPVNAFGGNDATAPVACGTPDVPLNVDGLTIIFAP